MRITRRVLWLHVLAAILAVSSTLPLYAEVADPEASEVEAWWVKPLPTPLDPELEQVIKEVQNGLNTIHQQMVRRKETLKQTTDPATKASLYSELEALRTQRDDMEALLHQLVEEAMISERTEIDEALARARWFERQQEYQAQKEEIIRDRQQ